MPYETFLYQKEGPVAKIVFNRTARLNRAVDRLARQLLGKPPMALARTKASINAVVQSCGANVGFCDSDFTTLCAASEDAREAVSAFLQKRPGNFKGR